MNISQPISSQLQGVSFGCLSAKDIRSLSAKRITNATTFDTLLNPVPGGLYTSELGQFGDNACGTCGLKNPQCPGHPGHIELPVPCYHPTFMDQILRLLRSACIYCGKLKMKRVLVARYICKLRLVKYGLLKELNELDELEHKVSKGQQTGASDSEEDEEGDAEVRAITQQFEKYTRDAIKRARKSVLASAKTEVIKNARTAIVRQFMADITKGKKCGNCEAINHTYRKDRFVKIFRKPLSEKDHAAMVQRGLRPKDPVIQLQKAKRANRKRKRDEDEAVADLDRSSEEEGDELEDSSEGEPEIVGGDVLSEAAEAQPSGTKPTKTEDYINPAQVRAHIQQLFERDTEVMNLVYGIDTQKSPVRLSADMFFIEAVLVPPNRYRPEAKTGNNEIAEAMENGLYKDLITTSENIAAIQKEVTSEEPREVSRYRARTYADLESAWLQLQDNVNVVIDRNLSPLQGRAGARNADGVKQKLEKKEGMFRKYMMGKRVNFAARTVISPDPNIETNEIGVPPVFAVKLTYPEPVNQHNYEDMQQAVKNGPYVWPGAVAIESETGAVLNLANKTADERLALANSLLAPSSGSNTHGARPKKVHRHLNNGDIVIMNRQPTLHKPSMMCHKARVLPGEKTLRMHYANCNTYNADFDGDEMNMHFPQNELARAEALLVADTDHQYLSGTAGNPLRGLIQDHISMCVWLTNRDLFFERGEYMNLLYAAIRPEDRHCEGQRLEIMPPAIMKPKPLWTGKQVISTVLKNLQPAGTGGLNMTGKSTLDASMWGDAGKEEAIVIFKDGELMTGILDKKQIGPSAGGFVNAVYEAYGYRAAGRLLSILGRLLTKLLHMRAFSCGVEDVILARNGEKNRRDVLTKAAGIGLEVAAKYVSMADQKPKSEDRELRRRLEDVMRDETKQQGLDQLTNSATSGLSGEVSTACMPGGLAKPFPKNQMQTMTTTGAKGSRVNANLISCNLGQQVLEGRRVPVMVSGKTLPCFKPFESNVRAGGYIVDRFLTGIRPQEYFFHAMAGREGLIDTAVKTSRSGYLQRCLIKGMEGLRAEHDSSVRHTEDGSIVQFLYGEDGLDIGKAKYLSDLKFTAENYLSLFHTYQMENSKQLLRDEVKDHAKAAEKKYRKTGDLAASDPALSLYPPGVYGGSISEKALSSSREFVDANKEKLIKDKKNPDGIVGKKNFNNILDLRYLKSVVEPGEAVGVVAGQSVGEPSTQMTLNTFHLAGHAAKNVTLGIPRLREIVMTAAANISTPAMTLVMNSGLSVDDAKKFAKGISKLSLAEIVDRVTVTESVGKGVGYAEARKYDIKLDFFPSEEYEKEYAITIQDVVATLEHRFLPRLQAAARKELKKRNAQKTLKTAANDDALPEVGQSAGRIEEERARPEGQREGGDDDSDDEGDDDATRDKSKSNKQQAGYEAYEDDDEQRLRQRQATPEPSDSEEEDETYGGSPRTSPEPGAQDDHQSARSVAKDREARIRGNDGKTNDIVTFDFDDKKGATCFFTMEYSSEAAKILILNIVELSLHQALIQSVPGMSLCMLDEDATRKGDGRPILAASGTNITAMWDYQHIINPHQIYTNSIHDVLIHYGVEAARNAIVKEISGVFGGHGISVDVRHLTLIADYMTRDGAYQAFSRMGYRNNPSPFMKMSFETTLNFLRDAVLEGDFDDLEGPSARIVAGRVGKMGTGGFDVLMPLHDSKESQEGDEDVEMEG